MDEDLLESMGVRVAKSTPDMMKAWMRFHTFVLVESVAQVRKIIDQAYERGICSLDLETQGLDSRIYYRSPEEIKGPCEEYWDGDRPERILQTVHKVVGYCISVDGQTGYYIPVRHIAENSNNLDPVAVGKLIKELCLAAQPILTEEGLAKDPLSSPLIQTNGKVKIAFWNAKFDQEFLYPVTGIDWWHPDSYEDSMLLYFARNTSDKNLSLKAKSKTDLYVKDKDGKPVLGIVRPDPHNPIQDLVELSPKGDRIPYEMIELKELFGKGREIKFAELHPTEGLRYGCSDGICTLLHIQEPGISSMIKDKKFAFMYRLDKQTQQITRIMERPRILIDIEEVKKTFTEAREEANEYRHQLVTLAEQHGFHSFDPQSSSQVSDFFFAKSNGLNIEPKPEKNEKSGQYKTDADTLEKLVTENDDVNPILLTLVKYRQIEKVIGTYLENMIANVDSNGELRYQFKQVGAATTRFSAPAGQGDQGFGGVPIHGIPATYDDKKPKVATKLRQLFKARPGYAMVKIDYSGEELRIVTNLSKEPVWINEFLNGTGDLHTITAQAFFGKTEVTKQERQMGKCVHPDTLVNHQERGFIPLQALKGFSETTDTFLPTTGDKLLARDYFQPVVATYNGGVKPLFHVVSRKGVLTCSAEHRFELVGGLLKRAGDLVKGDVLSPIQPGPIQEPTSPKQEVSLKLWDGVPAAKYTLCPDLAYFAGIYLGDGTASKKNAGIAHGAVAKLDFSGRPYAQWQSTLMQVLKSLDLDSEPKKDNIYLGSVVVCRFLQGLELVKGTERKLRVPSWILSGGREMILQFLGGLIDTDGAVSKKYGNIEFTTKDFVFGGQIAMLCKALGLDFACDPTYNKTYKRYYLRLRFTVGSSWQLRSYIRHAGKVARVQPGQGEMASKAKPENAVMVVIPAGEGLCLDVTMGTEEHLYNTNGFVTHNSANFSLVYGGGVQAVQRATKCNPQEAARRKANFDKSVPKFALWQKNQKAKAHKEKGVYSAFGRWMALTEIDSPEKYIVASCERQSTNFPVQSTGADIMRMALVMTHKEFYRRGWYQSGGVRTLLTVHDEIVFEVKFELLQEAVPVIEHIMCEPGRIAKWEVPLEAEPLVDLTWDAKYDFNMVVKGKPHKEGDKVKPGHFVAGSRQYQQMPEWMEPWVIPDWKKAGIDPGEVKETPKPEKAEAPKQEAPKPLATVHPIRPLGEVFSYPLVITTPNTVKQVWNACSQSLNPQGKVLHLVDGKTNQTLVSPDLGIRINPDEFVKILAEYNL